MTYSPRATVLLAISVCLAAPSAAAQPPQPKANPIGGAQVVADSPLMIEVTNPSTEVTALHVQSGGIGLQASMLCSRQRATIFQPPYPRMPCGKVGPGSRLTIQGFQGNVRGSCDTTVPKAAPLQPVILRVHMDTALRGSIRIATAFSCQWV